MRKVNVLAAVALAIFGVSTAASADVQVSMQGGHVTIVAKDATVRQILAEWSRVGQTKIVNAERIPGGPLTLELRDVPEQQALNILLRSVSGFLIAPRATAAAAANLSVFDRVIVLPTSVAPAAAASATQAPPAFSQPTFAQPFPAVREDEDEPPEPVANPNPAQPGGPANRGPVFVFPQPQVTNPSQRPPQQFPQVVQPASPPNGGTPPATGGVVSAPATGAPAGVSVPGMVVPGPPQQGPAGGVVIAGPQREQ